jgi:hypothetical protein
VILRLLAKRSGRCTPRTVDVTEPNDRTDAREKGAATQSKGTTPLLEQRDRRPFSALRGGQADDAGSWVEDFVWVTVTTPGPAHAAALPALASLSKKLAVTSTVRIPPGMRYRAGPATVKALTDGYIDVAPATRSPRRESASG